MNEKDRSVKSIMTNNIVTVEMDDTLAVVKHIFDNAKFHHLLVVEAGKLMGVVSDRDLLKSISPNVDTIAETAKDTASLKRRVHQVMSRKLVAIHKDAGMDEAIGMFNAFGVSCIPVIDGDKKPVGIISWRDILKVL